MNDKHFKDLIKFLATMNREGRRKWFKAHKKGMNITWNMLNSLVPKRKPYLNPNKKHVYAN